MTKSVLVTGGAGFIGTHLVTAFLERGYDVNVVDALLPQAHRSDPLHPYARTRAVRFVHANLCEVEAWRQLLVDVEAVVHLAADVSVGQSMYEIVRYVQNNALATAALLQTLLEHGPRVKKLVVASSMSIYGEGAYRCPACGVFYPKLRPLPRLQQRRWEMRCPVCAVEAESIPTSEDKPLRPNSIYAINKRDQEEMCLTFGRAYGLPCIALRFFNVYGPGQSLSNPYTGVAAMFSSRLINGHSPLVFEDGRQTRDFVHVTDVVGAILGAVGATDAGDEAYNIGSGQPTPIVDLARLLAKEIGVSIEPEVVQRFRTIDVRHCYADISKAAQRLGYTPQISIQAGVQDLVAWARESHAVDRVDQAYSELVARGLVQ